MMIAFLCRKLSGITGELEVEVGAGLGVGAGVQVAWLGMAWNHEDAPRLTSSAARISKDIRPTVDCAPLRTEAFQLIFRPCHERNESRVRSRSHPSPSPHPHPHPSLINVKTQKRGNLKTNKKGQAADERGKRQEICLEYRTETYLG
ncbi:uncharacterized protein LOC6739849 isoform X2 [Drosophila simulans]|uniref:uncharacterized protein LOC6739849 isoform X2 n=1 Tax=Drosophila simulans TaxID=7240 RepID=UPI00192CF896|nr:uncharacterized protein LOC6739849 isoform X2 [Drosophila simulans]